jgi:hypothetical protein
VPLKDASGVPSRAETNLTIPLNAEILVHNGLLTEVELYTNKSGIVYLYSETYGQQCQFDHKESCSAYQESLLTSTSLFEKSIANMTVKPGYNRFYLEYELGLANFIVLSSPLLYVDDVNLKLYPDLNFCHNCATKVFCINSCESLSSFRSIHFRATVEYRHLGDTYHFEFERNYFKSGTYTMTVSSKNDPTLSDTKTFTVHEGSFILIKY